MQSGKSGGLFDISVMTLDGRKTDLHSYEGRVLLFVNTASQCGFTPQYAELEELYQKYRDRGFTILGFPCNQFGAQEPGSSDEIRSFCETQFSVSFPIFSKIDVNGKHAHPLFRWLKKNRPGLFGTEAIKWNFTKFLVDRKGRVIERFAPLTKPRDLTLKIETELK